MHLSQTVLEQPPFTHTIDNLTLEDINMDKVNSITNVNLNDFVKICFEKFLKRYPRIAKGSVHIDPVNWVIILINYLKKNNLNLPNGCCTQAKCSINLYYEIILEEFLKEPRILNNNKEILAEYGIE